VAASEFYDSIYYPKFLFPTNYYFLAQGVPTLNVTRHPVFDRGAEPAEAGHILYLRILYPIHIQAQKKDIISYHYHGKKKDMDIYPISFVKNFASNVTVS
jgi:hypothetical protein